MAETKDIIKAATRVAAGIGGIVAGAYMGPAGASAVQTAAGGVDEILDLTISEDTSETKHRYDRADFKARDRAQAKGSAPLVRKTQARKESQRPRASIAREEERTKPEARAARSDSHIAERFLRQRGWAPEHTDQILSGPQPPPDTERRASLDEIEDAELARAPQAPLSPEAERHQQDIAYWRRALARADLPSELRTHYQKRLRDAGETT